MIAKPISKIYIWLKYDRNIEFYSCLKFTLVKTQYLYFHIIGLKSEDDDDKRDEINEERI